MHLDSRGFTQIPVDALSRPDIESLSLYQNALSTELGEIPTLEKLDLRWCRLEPLPVWVDTLRARGVVVFT